MNDPARKQGSCVNETIGMRDLSEKPRGRAIAGQLHGRRATRVRAQKLTVTKSQIQHRKNVKI